MAQQPAATVIPWYLGSVINRLGKWGGEASLAPDYRVEVRFDSGDRPTEAEADGQTREV